MTALADARLRRRALRTPGEVGPRKRPSIGRGARALLIGAPFVVAFCVALPEATLGRAIVGILGAVALTYLSSRPGPVAVALIAGFLVMEILLPILFKAGIPAPIIRTAGLWKEGLTIALVVAAVRYRRRHRVKLDAIDWLGALVVVLATCYFLFPGTMTSFSVPLSYEARKVAFRSLALPVVALLAVRHAGVSDVWRRRCLGAAVFVGLLLAVGSVIEMNLPAWWDNFLGNTVGLRPYRLLIQGAERGSVLTFADFQTATTQRSGSWYADPLTTGFTYHLPLAAALAMALARPVLRPLAMLGFVGIGLFLVQGRAALLGGVVIIIIALRQRDQKSPVTRTNLGLLLGAAAIVAFPFFVSSAVGERSVGAVTGEDDISAPNHIEATRNAADRVVRLPLGTGLGSSGGNSVRFGVRQGALSENHFLAVGIDMGVAGLILYTSLIVAVIRKGFRNSSDALGFAAASALLGTAVGGLFLHSLESPVIAFPALVAAGLAVAAKSERKEPASARAHPLPR